MCEISRAFGCLVGANGCWHIRVCTRQDGFAIQEEGEVISGESEVEDEGAGIGRGVLVALVPCPRS